MISPWGSPTRVWTPLPSTRPAFTSTQPTGGLGLARPTPFSPSCSARAMNWASPSKIAGSGQGPPVARAQATAGVSGASDIEQAIHKGLGVEGDEVLKPLAHAHEGDG